MKENPFSEPQPFEIYRRSRPARCTARRHTIYVSRVGEFTLGQERIVAATGEYLSVYFDLPVCSGADFDPASFPADAFRRHPLRGHAQLRTAYLMNEALRLDRPEEALMWMAVTAHDLCSNEQAGDRWGSVFGEAHVGHAGVWSLRYLGKADDGDAAWRRCLRRSFAVAAHEALHVLGLEHCTCTSCTMLGSGCLSGPLHLCPPCLRKLCWNRQLDVLPYLRRLREFLGRWQLVEDAAWFDATIRLLERADRK